MDDAITTQDDISVVSQIIWEKSISVVCEKNYAIASFEASDQRSYGTVTLLLVRCYERFLLCVGVVKYFCLSTPNAGLESYCIPVSSIHTHVIQ